MNTKTTRIAIVTALGLAGLLVFVEPAPAQVRVGVGIGAGRYYRPYYGRGAYYRRAYAPAYYMAPRVVYARPRPTYVIPASASVPAAMANPNRAIIRVRVPDPGAVVSFNGNRTAQTGVNRLFSTSRVTPGVPAHYRVRAEWTQDGQRVVRELRVPVEAGRTTIADFTRQPSETVPPPIK